MTHTIKDVNFSINGLAFIWEEGQAPQLTHDGQPYEPAHGRELTTIVVPLDTPQDAINAILAAGYGRVLGGGPVHREGGYYDEDGNFLAPDITTAQQMRYARR